MLLAAEYLLNVLQLQPGPMLFVVRAEYINEIYAYILRRKVSFALGKERADMVCLITLSYKSIDSFASAIDA